MVSEHLKQLDPSAVALAEEQADAAGITLKEHLERLIAIGTAQRSPGIDSRGATIVYAGHETGVRFSIRETTPRLTGPPLGGAWLFSEPGTYQVTVSADRERTRLWLDHAPIPGSSVKGTLREAADFLTADRPAPKSAEDLEVTGGASPALRQIAEFNTRVEHAAVLLSAAFVESAVKDFTPRTERRTSHEPRVSLPWYFEVVRQSIGRARDVRNALVHQWEPTAHSERLAVEAFMILTELTPSSRELIRICQYDRPRAFAEMARQLDAITLQLEHSAQLIPAVEGGEAVQPSDGRRRAGFRAAYAARLNAKVETRGSTPPSEEQRFAELRSALLEKAGGGLSLTQVAELLGISRQAVHKRVKARTVLGIMNGTELVLPRAQFISGSRRVEVLPGIAQVLKHFRVAGGWSALQFLVEPDSNLTDVPLHALITGRTEDVSHAAKVYLGIDED